MYLSPPSGDTPTGNNNQDQSGNAQGSGSVPSSGGAAGSYSSVPSTGGSGALVGDGAALEEAKEEIYAVEEINVVSISPRDTVDIEITIDELDIARISIGQECEVTFDAISGQNFEGKITSFDTTGTNEGGNTKYTATVTLDKEDDMLSGMNTHVSIVDEKKEKVMVIPVSALYEDGEHVYIYTGYDSKNDELTGMKEVTTGLSDGENVEILSGLETSDKIYYKYADSLTYTF